MIVNVDLTLAGVKASPRAPDLAVWSESSVATVGVNLDKTYTTGSAPLVSAIRAAGIPVLFGGIVVVDRRNDAYWNASVLVDKDRCSPGHLWQDPPRSFRGEHPVLRTRRPCAGSSATWSGIWNPWVVGDRFTTYHVPLATGGQMAFGTPICFEDAFSDLCRQYILRGADVLLNITNDSWSKTWSSEIQHFQVARFRAVENRRVLVRSTNGGVSGVVGPWGEVRSRHALLPADVARQSTFPSTGRTASLSTRVSATGSPLP